MPGAVGHRDRAAAVDGDGARVPEAADDAERSTRGAEPDQSVGVVDRDIDDTVGADGDAVGVGDEPAAGVLAAGAEGLDPPSAGVGRVDGAVGPDREPTRRDQPRLPRRQRGAVEPVAQDPAVRRVGDQHGVTGQGDAVGVVGGIRRERRSVGVGAAHTASLRDEVAAAGERGDAPRVGGGEAAGVRVLVREPHDTVVLAVGYDDRAVGRRSDRLDARADLVRVRPAGEEDEPVIGSECGHGDAHRHRHDECQR